MESLKNINMNTFSNCEEGVKKAKKRRALFSFYMHITPPFLISLFNYWECLYFSRIFLHWFFRGGLGYIYGSLGKKIPAYTWYILDDITLTPLLLDELCIRQPCIYLIAMPFLVGSFDISSKNGYVNRHRMVLALYI